MLKRNNIFLMALVVLSLFLGNHSSFAVEDAVIAVVNDELITLRDLRDYIQSTYVSLVAEGMKDEDIKKIMSDLQANGIDKLIEDKLILSEANKMGMDVREKLINDRIEDVKKKYPSEQAFLDALVQHGVTINDLRKKIIEQLKIKFAVEHEVRSQIFVNPQEVTDYYESHKQEFNKKERVNLESIYIDFGDDKNKARQRAQEALGKLKAGEDFQTVAKEYSQTPSLGTIERGQILPDVENIVFKLEKNEISNLVTVEKGIYIFKLTGRAQIEMASLKEVKDQVYNQLFQQKFRTKFEEWVKKLKKDAYVEIKE